MKFDSEKRYYVYVWFVKETGNVFYVGKGSGKRCKAKTRKDNPEFNKITKKFDCDYKIIKNNLTEKEAFDLEIETIAYYRENGSPIINILDGGANPPSLKGIPKSEEWKEKVRNSNKRYVENHPEVRRIRSERLKAYLKTEQGKIFSKKSLETRRTEDFRAKQSQRSREANNTDEYKEKQSKIIKEIWKSEEYIEKHSGANNWRSQAVRQYDLDGRFIKEYETITQAATETGCNNSKISAVARGKRKTTGGYVWKFVNDKHLSFGNRERNHKGNSACEIPILQLDKSGNFLMEYKSIAEAARVNNFNDRTNIISNLKGRTKTAYGYIWRYKHGNTVPSQNKVTQ